MLKKRIKRISWINKVILASYGLTYRLIYNFCGLMYPVDKTKVVFRSFNGKSYSCNPRAISEELHKTATNYQIVWLLNDAKKKQKNVPKYIKCVENKSFKAIYELVTSKFWVDNFPLSSYVKKKSNQIYIHTWHGDRGLKKVLYDSHKIDPNYRYVESEICDLMISGSNYCNEVYESAFHYKGEILQYGSPRNDLFINYTINDVLSVKRQVGVGENKKILMYAPTLRREAQNGNQSIGAIDLTEVLNELERNNKEEWICLIRAHSAVKGFNEFNESDNRIIDVTDYEDMQYLLLVTDFLITDYSSSAGDFALLKRPMILFQPDREKYLKDDRQFYFNIDQSPYTVVFSQEELLDLVQRHYGEDSFIEQGESILDFYGTFETGKASKMVVNYIMKQVEVT